MNNEVAALATVSKGAAVLVNALFMESTFCLSYAQPYNARYTVHVTKRSSVLCMYVVTVINGSVWL